MIPHCHKIALDIRTNESTPFFISEWRQQQILHRVKYKVGFSSWHHLYRKKVTKKSCSWPVWGGACCPSSWSPRGSWAAAAPVCTRTRSAWPAWIPSSTSTRPGTTEEHRTPGTQRRGPWHARGTVRRTQEPPSQACNGKRNSW